MLLFSLKKQHTQKATLQKEKPCVHTTSRHTLSHTQPQIYTQLESLLNSYFNFIIVFFSFCSSFAFSFAEICLSFAIFPISTLPQISLSLGEPESARNFLYLFFSCVFIFAIRISYTLSRVMPWHFFILHHSCFNTFRECSSEHE